MKMTGPWAMAAWIIGSDDFTIDNNIIRYNFFGLLFDC